MNPAAQLSASTLWGAAPANWAFTAGVLLLLGAVWVLLGRKIAGWRTERLARLKTLKSFDAVPTASPYRHPGEVARHAAERNVNARFSVMRGVLFVTLASAFGVVLLLPFLGRLPQTVLSFLVAIVVAIVGIAARPLIENFISGIVLSFARQLKVGDTVLLDSEHYGTVEDINATHTVLKLWDWRRYVVPNSTMLQKELISYSHKDNYLWTHVEFHVSPRADLEEVTRLACEAVSGCRNRAEFEAPQFWVREMQKESYVCWVAAWANTPEDAWYLRAEARLRIAGALKRAGIESHLALHDVTSRCAGAR